MAAYKYAGIRSGVSAEAQTAMAEGSQRRRLRGETRGVICGVQYVKFRKREAGIKRLRNETVLARSPEHYFVSKRCDAGLLELEPRAFEISRTEHRKLRLSSLRAAFYAEIL